LTVSCFFIWNSKETYTTLDKIDFFEEESIEIKNVVADLIYSTGYTSIKKLPLNDIYSRYPEFSTTAIQYAFFYKFLSDKYTKIGKIITRQGDKPVGRQNF
jgi:hypothetical protein